MSVLDDWLVDRDDEKSIIERRLASVTKQNMPSREIFQFWGMFGIGKTTLLQAFDEFFAQAKVEHAYIDLAQFTTFPYHSYIICELLNQLCGLDSKKGRVVTLVHEYQETEKQFVSISASVEPSKMSMDPRPNILSQIEDEFVHYLRTILEDRPVVLLFDRAECLTHGAETVKDGGQVRKWLEDLYKHAQIDQRLTIILGGRDYVHSWNPRNGNMRAAAPVELRLFNLDDTIDHWSRIARGTPYATPQMARFIHEFTLGHPHTNSYLENKLRGMYVSRDPEAPIDEPNQDSSPDWPVILREAAEYILEEWIGSFPESQHLKSYVRAIAPLRRFDRDTATLVFKKSYPDLAATLNTQRMLRYFSFLIRVTLLYTPDHSPDPATSVFCMQAPIRSLIIKDMKLNRNADCRQAHELARDIYMVRVRAVARSEFPSPRFQQAVAELLYHEAELGNLSGTTSALESVGVFTKHIDYALGEFFDPDAKENYLQMLEDLTTALEQDDDLKTIFEDYVFESLLEKLKDLRSTLPEHRRIDVFIVYNSKDRAAVEYWANRLRDMGITPWMDEWDIPKFADWVSELDKVIRTTNAAAVFIGPSGEGPWQAQEIKALLQQSQRRNIRMGCVLLPDSPNDIDSSVFLQNFQIVDLRKDREEQLKALVSAITGKRK